MGKALSRRSNRSVEKEVLRKRLRKTGDKGRRKLIPTELERRVL
jgi:hypothetical protein